MSVSYANEAGGWDPWIPSGWQPDSHQKDQAWLGRATVPAFMSSREGTGARLSYLQKAKLLMNHAHLRELPQNP